MKVRVVMNGNKSFTCTTSFTGAAVLCSVTMQVGQVHSFYACVKRDGSDELDWYRIWHRLFKHGRPGEDDSDIVPTRNLPSALSFFYDRPFCPEHGFDCEDVRLTREFFINAVNSTTDS